MTIGNSGNSGNSGTLRTATAPGQWQGVDVMAYKTDRGAPFKDVTRQVLFADPSLGCELRYFEVAPGGHSTLERHEHTHAVIILHGAGQCLIGDQIYNVQQHDLVSIVALTWHQFRSGDNEPLGFLCMVNAERDRPQLPNAVDLAALRTHPAIAAFIRAG